MTDQDTTIDEFVAEARAFLDSQVPLRSVETEFVWGQGSDTVTFWDEKTPEESRADVAAAQDWRRIRFDAGFGWISGPVDFGGRGLSMLHELAYIELEAQFDVPNQHVLGIGLGMVAPTILAHGSDIAKRRYLLPMHRGEVIGCQLFSEPSAGSDLASVQTRAVRDGNEWVITGQKVWTSRAQHAHIGEILARTDPDQPKHRGLTAFLVDMRAPGVEVRPLRQMTGGSSFNEVFLSDVRVADDHRLGAVNDGWRVGLTTLMNERAAIGTGRAFGGGRVDALARLFQLVKHLGLNHDRVVRDAIACLFIHHRVTELNNERASSRIRTGQPPGPELSVAKLAGSLNDQRLCRLVSEVLGPRLIADTGEWGTYAWSKVVLGQPGGRIAGGTDEVMRSVIAERVLGLPKGPAIDTTTPFREIASRSSSR